MKREELKVDKAIDWTLTHDKYIEFYHKSEADSVMDAYEARIRELESQLENVQASMYSKNVDLGMENHKLKERIKELECDKAYLENDKQVCAECHRLKELESENARLRQANFDNLELFNALADDFEELKKHVPVWHDFYKDPPRKYQKVIVYFLNHQGWSMQEASIQDDGWRPKFMRSELPQKWCEFPPPPTEESSATEKEVK